MDANNIVKQITDMTSELETADELHELLNHMTFTIGGMVCHFVKEDRSRILIELTQSLGCGLQFTAKSIGEPSDIEMIVGKAKQEE